MSSQLRFNEKFRITPITFVSFILFMLSEMPIIQRFLHKRFIADTTHNWFRLNVAWRSTILMPLQMTRRVKRCVAQFTMKMPLVLMHRQMTFQAGLCRIGFIADFTGKRSHTSMPYLVHSVILRSFTIATKRISYIPHLLQLRLQIKHLRTQITLKLWPIMVPSMMLSLTRFRRERTIASMLASVRLCTGMLVHVLFQR